MDKPVWKPILLKCLVDSHTPVGNVLGGLLDSRDEGFLGKKDSI